MIWIWIIFLSVLATVVVVLPTVRSNRPILTSQQATPTVLIAQIDEIKEDLARGLITDEEAEAAQKELKRDLIATSRSFAEPSHPGSESGRVSMLVGGLLVPLFAIALYSYLGAPMMSGQAVADLAQEREELARISDIAAQLEDRLADDPNGGPSEGWMLLGQTYSKMQRFPEAANAFRILSKRPEADSAVFSMLSEALIAGEQGVVLPEAEKAIDKAMELDPQNPAAVFYKSIALSQNGKNQIAYDLLIARLRSADGFYPWMESLVAQANRVGSSIGKDPLSLRDFAPALQAAGPTQEDVANAENMSEEDRQAFIRSMVNRLANRLETTPDDLDGWLRLANAYTVLKDNELAISAYLRAEALLVNTPEGDLRRKTVADGLAKLGSR